MGLLNQAATSGQQAFVQRPYRSSLRGRQGHAERGYSSCQDQTDLSHEQSPYCFHSLLAKGMPHHESV
jgi:hypothetical protein